MAAIADKMSFAEFQLAHERNDQRFEYWNGRAVQKGMPTWIHGLIQAILSWLLAEAGYKAASEVELRIAPEYHPKPDVIATKGKVEQPYPTSSLEVVIEILSEDDKMEFLVEKCQKYSAWGFQHIYVIDSAAKLVFQWKPNGLEIVQDIASIPTARLWAAVDEKL